MKKKAPTTQHIRPSKRNPPKASTTLFTDVSLSTPQALPSKCIHNTTGTQTATQRWTNVQRKDLFSNNDEELIPNIIESEECLTIPQSRSTSETCPSIEKDIIVKKPNSILRKNQKYSNNQHSKQIAKEDSEGTKDGLLVEDQFVVRDLVVERRQNQKGKLSFTKKPSIANNHATAIEGFIPTTTATVSAQKARTVKFDSQLSGSHTSCAIASNIDDDSPLVFSSLTDLMECAGTLPEQNDPQIKGIPTMVEAELNFSCMDPTEYERQKQNETKREHDLEAIQENVLPEEKSDDDDSGSDDLWEMFDGNENEEEEEEEETEPTPPKRAFLILWNAISLWVTPEAVAFVKSNGETHRPLVSVEDDVCRARCAGLLAQLPTEACFRLLATGEADLRATEQRLTAFLRCFNYSRPVTLETMELYRALACVLITVVLNLKMDGNVPEPCREVGMNADEYRYLTQSAIANFGLADSAQVDSGNNVFINE